MVLNRSAGERQPVAAAQQTGGLGGQAVRVLDRLRLVQDEVVEFHFAQRRHVIPEGAVGGQHEVAAGKGIAFPDAAAGARVVEHAQARREAGRLGEPVEHQRTRHHYQRGRQPLALSLRPANFEQREHLDGLAQTHVVREAAAEAEIAQEMEPAEAGALVAAQLAAESRRSNGRRDARELAQALAGTLEGFIAGDRRLVGQPGVEQDGLDGTKPHMVPFFFAQPRDGSKLLNPFLGEHPEAAIAQGDGLGPAADRLEHFRQRYLLPVEVRLSMEIEPVDAGGDGHPEAAGRAVDPPFRLDRPALGEERGHGPGNPAGGNLQHRSRRIGILIGAESKIPQAGDGLLLSRRIAEKEPSLRRLIETPKRRARRPLASLVKEGESRSW